MANKPKDFTESAVKLTNPPEVKEQLEQLSAEQAQLQKLQDEYKQLNPELADKIIAMSEKVSERQQIIRETVEEHGSYQDTENERYAVKYERKTAVYGNLPSFKKNFPKFTELCIKETIDVAALKGQIKGKLITVEELEKTKVLSYEIGFAFYIR